MQGRRWCFTLNNPTEDEQKHIAQLRDGEEHLRFLIAGLEVGANGTPHLQGYVELDRPSRLGALKRLLGTERPHLERAVGTADQNITYCSKEGNIVVRVGTTGPQRQGGRTDLLAVKELLDSGGSIGDVAERHFAQFVQYRRSFQAYLDLRRVPRTWRTQVSWIWGPTGSGKSRRALQEGEALSGGDLAWIADQTLQWFEPYGGHKGAVFDDFAGGAPLPLLLRLFDRYPMQVAIKGGFVQWSPRIVWVTSNLSPFELYGHHPQFPALERRLDEIIHLE